MKKNILTLALAFLCAGAVAQTYEAVSPNGKLNVTVEAGKQLTWKVVHDGTVVIAPSAIGIETLGTQKNAKASVWGKNAKVTAVQRKSVNETFATPFYKKAEVHDIYNQMTLKLKGGFRIEVRVYDDAAAYRLVSEQQKPLYINNETAEFNFDKDYQAFVPYVNDNRGGERYCYSFESYYDEVPLSQMFADSLAITPLMVCLDGGKKAVVMDAGVENYPGLYLKQNPATKQGLVSEFAAYPIDVIVGGFNRLNLVPTRRAEYIAKIEPRQAMPWRVVVVTENDAQLASCDISQRLAPACKITDTSWIKPGKVAWDWWNTTNLTGVDFRTGMNTPTYKYFIDFASKNSLEYIIIDEGWSTDESLFSDLNPEIDLPELIAYGKARGVGIILWAAWRNIANETEKVCKHYSEMGIKGFKIDFIDRDDQIAVASLAEIAEIAARHHLLLDYHGMKPNGLHRAYPNIVNYEGVKGLENAKWEPVSDRGPLHDFPRYDVTAPYLRMLVGPMDYTPGAMENKTRMDFRANNPHPMSMGTRVHQMAMYVMFDAPLQMLADSPTAYEKNQECTDFIAKVPTIFDETLGLNGEVGEYLTMARRIKGTESWLVGAMTNWQERDLCIDLSFLGEGTFTAEIFADGINADKEAKDYKRTIKTVTANDKLVVHLMSGGGWVARFIQSDQSDN